MDTVHAQVVEESRQVLARHAATFSLASLFLPPDQQDDAAVVYTLCRTVDDLVDEAEDVELGRQAIEELGEMLDGRRPGSALADAFLEVAQRRDIPLQAAHDLMAGVVSDVGEVTLAEDVDLVQYGYAVAGTVGLMMCSVIGVQDEWALAHAIDLGVGMQITNICRDVIEDAGRGRIYIPARRLIAAGVEPEALRSGIVDPAELAPVIRGVLDLADRYYASGDQGMPAIPVRPRMAIYAASRVYRAIGQELRRRDCDVTRGRAVVPSWRKAGWVAWAVGQALLCPLFPRVQHDARLHAAIQGRPGVSSGGPALTYLDGTAGP
jgi:phytoene synthase